MSDAPNAGSGRSPEQLRRIIDCWRGIYSGPDNEAEEAARLVGSRVWVLTRYREFVSVHSTREGAEAARATLIEADMAERASSPIESVRESAGEPPDTAVVEVAVGD